MSSKYPVMADPALARRMFDTTQYAWIWAIIRVYVGYSWVTSGWGKITGKGWVDGGASLQGYWTRAVAIPEGGRPAITYDWYRGFLNMLLESDSYTWFGPMVAYGEVIIGICLIAGLLTGFAAFGGAFMNFNFMLAGSASTNPVLFLFALVLILAWKSAGYYGADRWVLPKLGTPWRQPDEARAKAS